MLPFFLLLLVQRAPAAPAPSVDRPCSFVTAAEMSTLLGTPVTMSDEHFRCKYVSGQGWLQVELLNFELRGTRDIFDYDKAHGKAVPGVGDQAYLFGAAIVSKVGDVVIAVDGNNLPRKATDQQLKTIALKISHAIP
jgi:hypothetical protein